MSDIRLNYMEMVVSEHSLHWDGFKKMKNVLKSKSIREKTIFYTISVFVLTFLLVALSVTVILKNLYREHASTELTRAIERISKEISDIELRLERQSAAIATVKTVVSTADLVYRYQGDGQGLSNIFDNDKKMIANNLLGHVMATDTDSAAVYAGNGQLIAYARFRNDEPPISLIQSYTGDGAIWISRANVWEPWVKTQEADVERLSLDVKMDGTVNCPSKRLINEGRHIAIESGATIYSISSDRAANSSVGCVVVRRKLDEQTLRELSTAVYSTLTLRIGSANSHAGLLETNRSYEMALSLPTQNGPSSLVIAVDKEQLSAALSQSYQSMLVIFLVITAAATITTIYLLNKIIVRPLSALVDAARNIPKNGKEPFPVEPQNNEISELGRVLNSMVSSIKKQEAELSQRQQELVATQRMAKLGSWRVDVATREAEWSHETYQIFEHDSKTQTATSELFYNSVHPDDAETVKNTFYEAARTHSPFDLTFRLQLPNGKLKYVRAQCSFSYSSTGEPLYANGLIQDITELAQKNEFLRRSQKMDALGKLTGGIAHDFNNLLNVIVGYCSLIQSQPLLDKKITQYVDEVARAGERAAKLTSKLLSFSRTEIRSAIYVDINQLLFEDKNMLERTLTARIKLTLNLESNLWGVWLEKDELQESLLNLCINSMHAMPDGGELTLTTSNVTIRSDSRNHTELAPGDYVVLTVSDTGTGMDQVTVQRVFEPFFTTKGTKGTGLGMSQVYGFIQRSKGDINITSELGKGTKVTLYFPRHQSVADADDDVNRTENRATIRGTETILVVDDEAQIRLLLNTIFSAHGYYVLDAESGRKALTVLENNKVDLIMSDVIMPEMDGYQLAAIVQERFPDVVIQMMSGFVDEINLAPAVVELHGRRLMKPFNVPELLGRVEALLSKKLTVELVE